MTNTNEGELPLRSEDSGSEPITPAEVRPLSSDLEATIADFKPEPEPPPKSRPFDSNGFRFKAKGKAKGEPAITGGGWKKFLDLKITKTKDGTKTKLASTQKNVELFLRNFPTLKGLVLWDEIRQRVCFAREVPEAWIEQYPSAKAIKRFTPWQDVHDSHLNTYLGNQTGMQELVTKIPKAIIAAAMENRVNPILEWLVSLIWDGIPRIESWLIDCLNVENTEYSRFVGQRWLLSGVARICNPGEKVDHVLMLEGDQDLGKSTALERLGGEWYSNADIGDLKNKESILLLQGCWILELAEGDIFKSASQRGLKAFITKAADDYIRKYENNTTRSKRTVILALTTNDRYGYLKDPTGNRRYWPVAVQSHIDLQKLEAARDQLWAEVYHLYQRDWGPDSHVPFDDRIKWWPETEAEKAMCRKEVELREEEDELLPAVQIELAGTVDTISIADLMGENHLKVLTGGAVALQGPRPEHPKDPWLGAESLQQETKALGQRPNC